MLDKNLLIKHLMMAKIVILGENNVKGSFSYMDFGLKIRNKMYSYAIQDLRKLELEEIHLSDIIRLQDVQKLDAIEDISSKYFSIDQDIVISAGHEVPFYLLMKNLIKNNLLNKIPSGFFHFGSVYRKPKKTIFPFDLGERRSFLESYFVYTDTKDEAKYFSLASEWNKKFIKSTLNLPMIEVERPLITNKQFSKKTKCIDTLTPYGKTINTGMVYLHDNIFSSLLNVKYKSARGNKDYIKCVHFGISDNAFFSYLVNSHDGKGFRLLTSISPYLIQINCSKYIDLENPDYIRLIKFLDLNKISYELFVGSEKNMGKQERDSIIKGIPLVISIFKNKETINFNLKYRGEVNIHRLEGDLNIINEFLEKNDIDIKQRLDSRQKELIVKCETIDDINTVLSEGKTSMVFLEFNNKNVKLLESEIDAGEILGFSYNPLKDIDILSGNPTNSIAYISRRM